MNAYTLEQKELQDNELYSDIAYKEHIRELVLKSQKRNEFNKAGLGWQSLREKIAYDNHLSDSIENMMTYR